MKEIILKAITIDGVDYVPYNPDLKYTEDDLYEAKEKAIFNYKYEQKELLNKKIRNKITRCYCNCSPCKHTKKK